MVEVEGLKVIISAEIKTAIENIRKIQDGMNKLGATTKKEAEKTTSFLTKFKLGWIALGVAAVGVLYSIIKQSPLLNAYMSEFGDILGYLGDTIGTIFAPFIEIALEGLWKFSDWFELNAPMIQAAIMPLLPIWQEFINIMVEAGKVILPVIVDVIAKIIKFLAELLTAIAKGDWDKAWKVISDAASGVWTWIEKQFDKLLDWMSRKVSEHDWQGFWQYLSDAFDTLWKSYILPNLDPKLVAFLDWMDEFFNKVDATRKIQMIAAKIVDAMDWAALGIAAAKNFLSNLATHILNNLPPIVREFAEFAKGGNPKYLTIPPALPYEGPQQTGTAFVPPPPPPIYIPEHEFWSRLSEAQEVTGHQMGTSFVPETGLYTLHRGEVVIPRGKSVSTGSTINFSPTINILNPQIKSDMDVRQLANQLTSYWRDDMQRYVRGVVA